MGRHPLVPAELTQRPFSLAEARGAGLTREQLAGSMWRRVGHGVYAWSGIPDTPMRAIAAVRARLPAGAAFAGRTAGWLHGLDLPPCDPIQVIVPAPSGMTARGLWISRARLDAGEVVSRWGMPVTPIRRTLRDLSRRLPLVEAVVIADMALHLGLVELEQLDARAARFAEPAAESPMETRLRMLLVQAGLPRPEAQVSLYDDRGEFIARADLYYPSHRLVLEYDGSTHRERLVADNRRQNALLSAGFQLLRFTAPDVLDAPDSVAGQVRAALGYPALSGKRTPKARARTPFS
jgi:very-short-patch-repair endonuclease